MLYKVDISQFGQHSVKSLCCHSQWGNIKLVLAIEQKNLGIKKQAKNEVVKENVEI